MWRRKVIGMKSVFGKKRKILFIFVVFLSTDLDLASYMSLLRDYESDDAVIQPGKAA